MDHIMKLLTINSLDIILVIVNQYLKMVYFIPSTKKQTVEQVWADCWQGTWKLHKMSQEIIIDQGMIITSKWWKLIMKENKINYHMTIAYHFQANGQTKSINQKLKQYLQKYINFQQDNWPELVPLAKYTYNITKTQGIDFTLYHVVYSKTLRITMASEKPSQAAIDEIRRVAYKNLLYSQVLL